MDRKSTILSGLLLCGLFVPVLGCNENSTGTNTEEGLLAFCYYDKTYQYELCSNADVPDCTDIIEGSEDFVFEDVQFTLEIGNSDCPGVEDHLRSGAVPEISRDGSSLDITIDHNYEPMFCDVLNNIVSARDHVSSLDCQKYRMGITGEIIIDGDRALLNLSYTVQYTDDYTCNR